MWKCILGCGALIGFLSAVAGAQSVPSIVVGNDVLLPNWPTVQTIQLNVTGGQPVNGLVLDAQIADGGPGSGGTAGPSFAPLNPTVSSSPADLITGTIFASNNAGQQDNTSVPSQSYSGSLITSSGTVNANGLLATMGVSTSAIGPGTYTLKLARFINAPDTTSLGVDSNFNPIIPNITNGNLVVLYPGDTNKDGVVNLADLLTLTRNFGKVGTWATGDTNGDGVVNLADFQNLSRNFGKSINLNPSAPAISMAALSAQVAVPEPAALGVLSAVSLLFCRRSRRRK